MDSGAELHQICATSEEKYLGIIFSQDLKGHLTWKFNLH